MASASVIGISLAFQTPQRVSKRSLQAPYLIFLCETRFRNSSSSRIQASLGMEGCFTVDFRNGCNGLMMLWNHEIKVNLFSYSAIHVDVTVDSPTGSFRFTRMHGHCIETKKHLNCEKVGVAASLEVCLTVFLITSSAMPYMTVRREATGSTILSLMALVALLFVTSIFTAKSDHTLLLMDTSPIIDTGKIDCLDIVHTAWQYMPGTTIDKFHAVGGGITAFEQQVFLSAKREHKTLLTKEEQY
ncbi:hypothetical protein GQ457_06G013700 [Hibiscus cannabinus]